MSKAGAWDGRITEKCRRSSVASESIFRRSATATTDASDGTQGKITVGTDELGDTEPVCGSYRLSEQVARCEVAQEPNLGLPTQAGLKQVGDFRDDEYGRAPRCNAKPCHDRYPVMGDEERFRDLFRSSYPRLHRYARNRGLTGPDADDLVAATLEIAWRRLDDIPLDDPAPWLFAVARNLWRNRRRADERARTLLERLESSWVEAEPGDAGGDADVRLVRAALERLGDDDRELLVLIAWDELTPTEAAAVLGCSSVAARTRLHRARRRLAAQLTPKRVQRAAPAGQIRVVPTISTSEVFDG